MDRVDKIFKTINHIYSLNIFFHPKWKIKPKCTITSHISCQSNPSFLSILDIFLVRISCKRDRTLCQYRNHGSLNVSYTAGVVASTPACNVQQALEPVGAHWDTDWVELQASAIYAGVLDTALKVAPKG